MFLHSFLWLYLQTNKTNHNQKVLKIKITTLIWYLPYPQNEYIIQGCLWWKSQTKTKYTVPKKLSLGSMSFRVVLSQMRNSPISVLNHWLQVSTSKAGLNITHSDQRSHSPHCYLPTYSNQQPTKTLSGESQSDWASIKWGSWRWNV